MNKPTVYLDTSVFSAYWYEGADVTLLTRRLHTREWWELERQHYGVWASAFVEAELRAGEFLRQDECGRMARRLRYLSINAEVTAMMNRIIESGLVPTNKRGDAGHLAVSAFHDVDYLLTWNYAHMANPTSQGRLEALCTRLGLVAPLMVSPDRSRRYDLARRFGGGDANE